MLHLFIFKMANSLLHCNSLLLDKSVLSIILCHRVFQGTVSINLGLDAMKPVFGVPDKARLKPVSSATALIRLHGCAG